MNDAELVQRLRRHDPAAVQHLVQCYLPSVWRFVYVAANGDRHLAEDIVSETVLAFLKAAAAPEAEFENAAAWLRAVASHKLHDHFRAAARVQHLLPQAAARTANRDADPALQPELQERRAAVRSVMNGLPEPQRLALEWKYLDRLSVREIADRMNVTEKAAESILFRARREFRAGLNGLLGAAVPENGKPRRDGETSPDDALPPALCKHLSKPLP